MLAHCTVCYSKVTCDGNVACYYVLRELMDQKMFHAIQLVSFIISISRIVSICFPPHTHTFSLSLFIIARMYLVVIFTVGCPGCLRSLIYLRSLFIFIRGVDTNFSYAR